MRVSELLNESTFSYAESKLIGRFKVLGIEAATDYFLDWIYHGKFNLPHSKLAKFEAAFYLIRSVLPPNVLRSYDNLPTQYRGMVFSSKKLNQISNGGLPIQSRIMAWSPDVNSALLYLGYTPHTKTGVLLKYKPKEQDVVLSMNSETEKFLDISPFLVANPGETILSLPLLKITPEIVYKIIR